MALSRNRIGSRSLVFSTAAALGIAALFAGPAAAAPFLQLDFQPSDLAQRTQPGYTAVGVPNATSTGPLTRGPFTTSQGNVSVTLTNPYNTSGTTMQTRDRAKLPDNTTNTASYDLYDDFIRGSGTSLATTGLRATMSGAGIVANQWYLVTVYSFDILGAGPSPVSGSFSDNTQQFSYKVSSTPSDTTFQTLGSVTYRGKFDGNVTSSDYPTSPGQYAVTGWAQATSAGELIIEGRLQSSSRNDFTTPINGITVEVPEPTAIAGLAVVGLIGLQRRRRRRD
jgi:hypothetical protein